MHVTRYGQSALLIEDAGTKLLLDPGTFSGDEAFGLTGLDAILITHEHPDHCDPTRIGGLFKANPAAPVFAPEAVLDLLGVTSAVQGRPVTNGSRVTIGAVTIEAVGAVHQEILPGLPRCANSGFVITGADGTRLYHPGDSYETFPQGIDVLAVPLLGPWSSLRETVEFVAEVAPGRMFPIHDALLSTAGRALFWKLLSGASDPSIQDFDATDG